ncbi:calponin-1 isoform X1 [Molossus molossus]|uniref:calponin-1 isoform X1 n=1 Tax=Molossus molossus TaxID=27622 RepID=UPI001745E519|nr:calponin-1 isoform X1 [Molossus molossus]
MANGMALEEARAASVASKTCEEGRGCRQSLSCCSGPQSYRHHCPPPASMSSAHFNRGPAYGLSAEVKNKLAQKYDLQREQELREWIEGVTGRRIGNNFMDGLKDGIILCEFINKLQPGSVKKVNESTQNWHQLENIGNFIKAITKYGVKPHDIFEANDLFENTNHTQVQSTLLALASMAKTKGNKVNVGVKYAEKQERKFEPEKLREGRNIIGLQMGTNKFASQQGMTAYGTRRHLYDPKLGTDQPLDQATISLQMGTNKGASQAGMTAPGTKRQIFEPGLGMEHCDTLNVSLQMGSNKGASQQGMTVYGLPRQVYDPKYCLTPEYPELGEPAHNHHPHNYYNSA